MSELEKATGTSRRLNLDALRPLHNELVLYGRVWQIPAEITIPVMAEFLALESRIKSGGDGDATEAVEAINDAHIQIERMLSLDPTVTYHPDTAEFTVKETGDTIQVQLSVREILAIIAFLIGNDAGAEAEVAEALSAAGQPTGADGEPASRELTDETEDGHETPTPLASKKRSSSRSRGTRTRSTSSPDGGESASGETGSSRLATPSLA